MAIISNPKIIKDNLVLCLDARNPKSYSGSGNTWKNIVNPQNNATLNSTTFSSALLGAIAFNGSSSRGSVTLPISSSSNQTYEIWTNAISSANSDSFYAYLLHINGLNNTIGSSYMTIGINPSGYYFGGFNGVELDTSFPALNSNYNQIILTWDGSVQKIYVNGVLKNSENLSSTPQNFSNTLSIGDYSSSSFRMINGNISSIKVYDKALSESEIKTNFNAYRNKFPTYTLVYDEDAQAYFDAVETAGGSFNLTSIESRFTEAYIKRIHNDFYAGLKTDGLWDKLTEFYFLVGKTFGGITIKGKGSGTLTNNNFVSGDLLAAGAGAGLSGNGSTKYIDTGFNNNLLEGDSRHMAAYNTSDPTSDGGLIGYGAGETIRMGDQGIYGIGGSGLVYGKPHNAQYTIATKRNVNDVEYYVNGISNTVDNTSNSYSPPSVTFKLFWTSYAGQFTNTAITFAHIGTGLTDTDAANLSLRVNKLMYDLGCEVYVDSGIINAMNLDSDVQTYANAVLAAGGNWETLS